MIDKNELASEEGGRGAGGGGGTKGLSPGLPKIKKAKLL
jgi:hypothetical protein